MALANLVWGFGAILFGFWSDKYGAGRTAATGVLCSMAGFFLITQASTGTGLLVAGVLLGLGSSGSGVTALVGAVSRAVPPHSAPRRSLRWGWRPVSRPSWRILTCMY